MPSLKFAFILLLSLALNLAAAETPNIVVILADDLGIGDLSAYNAASKIRTPHMNKLAGEGLRFTDMHTPSSVCTPTRYGLMTGRYCWRSSLKKGVLWGFSPVLIEPNRPTLASMLKSKGYDTAGIGKWHLGLGTAPKTDYSKPFDAGPLTAGFDSYFGIPASLDMEPYVWVKNDRVENEPTETSPGSKHQRDGGDGFWRAGPSAPGFKHVDVLPRLTQAAVNFIADRTAKPAKPFFLYLPLTGPHTPWLPTPEFLGKSAVGAYGDFVEQTDATVGAILAALDTANLRENTLVILTSDNGSHWPVADIQKWDHRANANLRGQKADIHEAGHRVPFLARWPARIKPGVTAQTACLTDLYATLATLVGTEIPASAAEDSYSLTPLFESPAPQSTQRDATIHHSGDGMFAIRMGDWKLIEGLGSGGFTAPKFIKPKAGEPVGQLYNLKDDPSEAKNLYAENPERVAELMKRLNTIRDNGRSR